MKWTGKLLGGALGLLMTRGPLGALIGAVIGHVFDSKTSAANRDDDSADRPEIQQARGEAGDAMAVAARFFRTTFEVMGHVAKSDGRVSPAEIDAARAVMQDFRLSDAQTDAAIEHFRRGKQDDYELDAAILALRKACAGRPDLLHAFLEIQMRAALAGNDLKAPARERLRRIATIYGVDGLEFAHIESVLRLRSTQQQRGAARANDAEALASAYRVLEVSAEASSEEIEKAYRRQLSRHHPDKLKANGLPETMLEHAKQRTQQIIEAWEKIKARRGLARE